MTTLDLSIAGLGLRLHVGPFLADAVRERYAGFVDQLTRPDVELTISEEDRSPGMRRELPQVRSSGGMLSIEEPDSFAVELDSESGRGTARCPIGVASAPLTRAPAVLRGVVSAVCAAMLPRRRQGFLLHAAGVVVQGHGVCAVGESGAGKSTLCAMYPESEQLNDELVAVVREPSGSYTLHATPFSGTLELPRRRRAVPLALGLVLHKAAAVRARPAETRALFRLLLRCATLLRGDELSEKLTFEMCAALHDAAAWRDFDFMRDAATTTRAVRNLVTELV